MKNPLVGLVGAWLGAMFGLQAWAQEITVSEPQWFEQSAPPEVLATVRSRMRPVYPERLEATISGYVIVRQSIDANGKRTGSSLRATFTEFENSVAVALPELTMKPAQTEKRPVASNAWLTVIFNAANTAPKKPDAQPRLLAVAPAVLARELRRNPGPIWINLSLDEKGMPQKFVLEDAIFEEFRPNLEEALKEWKFAPARKAGVAVAAEVRVALFVVAPTAPSAVARGTPPKPIRQNPPVYPPAMRRSGLVGEVTVGFEVDVKGNVINAVSVRSNNPGFEAAAIECVTRWKFDPAIRDGKPVQMKVQIPIIFTLDNGASGREAVTIKPPAKAAQQNIPAEYRYDVAPKARTVVLPVYPYRELHDGVKGKAIITGLIDARGRVTEIAVAEASQPAFGQALAAAFAGYAFEPAMREGKPTATLLRHEHDFDPDAGNDLTTEADLRLLTRENKKPETILTPDKLDKPLKPTVQRPPDFPGLLLGKVATGESMVEFLIDDGGHARLPRVVSATEEAFGFAAVQAIATWQFEPPVSGGKPAVVRARIPVKFAPRAATTEKPAAKN